MATNLENEVLDERALAEALGGLAGWERKEGAIQKTFAFPSFLEAIAFVNRVAVVAENLDHHPDFEIHYRQVTLRCWTHKVNALTRADLQLARDVENVK